MFRARLLILAIAASGVATANASELKLLFLGDQQAHQPAERFAILEPVMAAKGIRLKYTENVGDLNEKTLAAYDGLVLYANIDSIEPAAAKALLDYVASGKGFVPIHCATYCFRNSPEVVALMGAQFQRHGTGEMTTQPAGVEHPITDGYKTFTSWDETYVHHLHNDENRVVLEYRAGDMQAAGNTREPWTWIRTHGAGRVFYTAWGHDERTWNQSGFQDLLERGIRWACGEGDAEMGSLNAYQQARHGLPAMRTLPSDLKPFEYVDVGSEIPNYPAGQQWGKQEKPLSLMQQPLAAAESMEHIVTPEGFHVELFADETDIHRTGSNASSTQENAEQPVEPTGKPIAMNWDSEGRLWICETIDYPNELRETAGRDRVRVLADTDGDGRADQSTVFAENLSIPTAIAFHRGGVVVQNGTETLYLKDTDGDGQADVREVLISNWKLTDTHGGVSNFRNGLDNWIWAMQGYNDSAPVIDGVQQPSFRMGFFRFKLSQDDSPKVEQLEFVRSTTNNTWGLGISEEGLIFGSTANRAPSFFMPIANRYYERVKGWAPERLEMICDDHLFDPITDKVRQVDHHGGYTAGAGHALYTARSYPQTWWNRTAFVCGPTGKLVGTFAIERDGAGMKSDSPINLFASDDEWTAPIMAEVGPDGNVWVLDWYNYIVQHNPTPQGFETGKGQAYETKLRDKKYGRIYKVVPDGAAPAITRKLSEQSTAPELVAGLTDPTMLVRLHAQRLLIERGSSDAVPALVQLIADESVDEIGLNVGAIHALHTLQGLGQLESGSGEVFDAVVRSLKHPSAGVRLNAVRVLPSSPATFAAMQIAGLFADEDAQVLLASLLKTADTPVPAAQGFQGQIGSQLNQTLRSSKITNDRWLTDALTSAGAMHASEFLAATLADGEPLSPESLAAVRRVAEHFARSAPDAAAVSRLLLAMNVGANAGITNAAEAVVSGLAQGWPREHTITLESGSDESLRSVFSGLSDTNKAALARLAAAWSNQSLQAEIASIIDGFANLVADSNSAIDRRLAAADELLTLDPAREASADALMALIGPQSPPQLSIGLAQILSRSKSTQLGDRFREINAAATPELRSAIVRIMLSRPELTTALLTAMEVGEFQVADFSTEQRGLLTSNASRNVRRAAEAFFRKGGVVTNSNRDQLVASKMSLTEKLGKVAAGQTIFTKHCATCHVFKGEGNVVGPNLNGMSVHPKAELLTHILDPNRSVEANYRLYTVLTADGVVLSGLLSAESLTTIEIVDSLGKRQTVLREDIEQLRPSTKSAMPEGFEQSIDDNGLVDLLEYLTQSDQFVPLGLENVANVSTTQGMFYNRNDRRERLALPEWGIQVFGGVPFSLVDPQGGSTDNAVMLQSPNGPFAPELPTTVQVRCRTAAKAIHILGGVGGWAARGPSQGGVSMIVRLVYADGETEDHPLVSGQHIADYNGRFDVPQSKFACETLNGGQLRYLSIEPRRDAVIDTIELVKPSHPSAPITLAITVEIATANAPH